MKILWIKSDFLHPATTGGHIRTLETLRRLHRRHEIHYVAFDLAGEKRDPERSCEYCSHAYPIPHSAPRRSSPAFWLQLGAGLCSPLPLALSRYRSDRMSIQIEHLLRGEKFDAIVCDFLRAAVNVPDLSDAVLFQHNVEALIWKRHAEHAPSAVHRRYFQSQYERMARHEREICRSARRVIAVSSDDAQAMRSLYDVQNVEAVPTGVDIEYFTPPVIRKPASDLVFLGSMDWMPNIDGIQWFVKEVLPLIRRRRPDCSLAIVGRRPTRAILDLARRDPLLRVSGTVDDIRPYLWDAAVSIVPLRIGGGTRLKIYEAMAAQVPVVSTPIGAQGLDVRDGEDIFLAGSPHDFAASCLALLGDPEARRRLSQNAWEKVSTCYSWDVAAQKFEALLA